MRNAGIRNHILRALLVGMLAITSTPAFAESSPPDSLRSDPVLARLVADSLAARPEIAEGEALVRAETARAPQARAFPDPILTVGIQNDGFSSIELGKMGTSWVSIMASQTFPWPGKRGLRSEIADAGAAQSKRGLERIRLSTEADVERTYLGLLLARDRLVLLDRLMNVWEKSAAAARAVYESGRGSQADVMRSQLELGRLKQRRLALAAEENALVQGLNRLRRHPLDERIETRSHLADLGVPAPIAEQTAVSDAMARSPELAASRLGLAAAERSVTLANRSYYPDLTVTAGVMPRGGPFPPMWLVSVGGPIPIFAGSRQNRAVDEAEARTAAGRANVEAVEQLIQLRVKERSTALAALIQTIRVYKDGLLVQSEATASSTLAQYEVGKIGFASVLEANAGYLADQDAYLQSVAQAQRVLIAARELSMEPVAAAGGVTMPAAAFGGTPRVGASADSANAERSSM